MLLCLNVTSPDFTNTPHLLTYAIPYGTKRHETKPLLYLALSHRALPRPWIALRDYTSPQRNHTRLCFAHTAPYTAKPALYYTRQDNTSTLPNMTKQFRTDTVQNTTSLNRYVTKRGIPVPIHQHHTAPHNTSPERSGAEHNPATPWPDETKTDNTIQLLYNDEIRGRICAPIYHLISLR